MKIKKKISVATLLAFTLVGGLSACGSKEEPKVALDKAVTNPVSANAGTVKVRFETDPTSLGNIVNEFELDSNEEDKEQINKIVKTIATTTLSFESKTKDGKPLDDNSKLENLDWGFFADVDGTRTLNTMLVDGAIYGKVDAVAFAEKTELISKEEMSQFKDDPSSPEWFKAFMDNKWVNLDKETTNEAIEEISTNSTSNAQIGDTELTEQQSKDLAKAIKKTVMDGSTVVWEGDSLKMDIPVKALLPKVRDDIKRIVPEAISDDANKDFEEALTKLNDNKFTIFANVKDDRLTQVKFDVLQFVKIIDESTASDDVKETISKFKKHSLNIVFDISYDAPSLKKPEGSIEVNKEDLQGMFGLGSSEELASIPGSVELEEDSAIDGIENFETDEEIIIE